MSTSKSSTGTVFILTTSFSNHSQFVGVDNFKAAFTPDAVPHGAAVATPQPHERRVNRTRPITHMVKFAQYTK